MVATAEQNAGASCQIVLQHDIYIYIYIYMYNSVNMHICIYYMLYFYEYDEWKCTTISL